MFICGQRYFSESEPELGLGIVLKVEFGNVEFLFPATETRRLYVSENAPVKRVSLRVGQTFSHPDGYEFKISNIKEEDGFFL